MKTFGPQATLSGGAAKKKGPKRAGARKGWAKKEGGGSKMR